MAACSDPAPRLGPVERPAPDLAGAAFTLAIDVQTGVITVRDPGSAPGEGTGGPSFSLLGSEAVGLTASDCVFTPLPPNGKKKRCTFDLSLTNLLGITDLVTPTTFPQPPAGTDGLLVFPYVSAALGVEGGPAVANSDWDHDPVNLFNDFTGCSNGNSGDCYRYELYPSPLFGGETSDPREVGFDVDKNASSVQAYVVVAADLRDKPPVTTALLGEWATCGPATAGARVEAFAGAPLAVGLFRYPGPLTGDELISRGFCGFGLASLPAGAVLVSATLRLFEGGSPIGVPYHHFGDVQVDHLDFGPTLEPTDYSLAALLPDIGPLSTEFTVGYKELDVTAVVQDDLDNFRAQSQFRIRFDFEDTPLLFGEHVTTFDGIGGPHVPEPLVTYKNP